MGATVARITTTTGIMTVMAAAMITREMATTSTKEKAMVPGTMAMDAVMIGITVQESTIAMRMLKEVQGVLEAISVGTERTTAITESDPYTDNFAYERDATVKDDCVPMTYITAKSNENSHTFRMVLFHSGGTYSSIMRSSVPCDISLQSAEPKCLLSASGLTTHHQVVIRYYEIPQILRSHHS